MRAQPLPLVTSVIASPFRPFFGQFYGYSHQGEIMTKSLSRPLSQGRKIIGRFLVEDTGTAAVLTLNQSFASVPEFKARLFASPTGNAVSASVITDQHGLPRIQAEGNHSAEYQFV